MQNSQENPYTRVAFLIKLQLKKRLWHRCFQVNFANFLRKTFFTEHLRWLPLVKKSLWNSENFSFSYFWLQMISWAPSTLWHYSCKTRYPQKNSFSGFHSYFNSNFKAFKLNKNSLQWYVLNRKSFLNDSTVTNTSLFNFDKKKIVRQFDVRSHVTQDIGDTRLF